MPEVPSNMQEGLAHLELEARETKPQSQRITSGSSISTMQSPPLYPPQQRSHSRETSQNYSPRPNQPGYTASYEHTNASAYQNISQNQYGGSRRDRDSPKFSPFPKIRDPGGNVPLSDEEKEEVLDRARPLVLQSSDPEMQLAWAQDALSWVEVAQQSYIRQQTEGQMTRSVTPKVEHQLRVDALNIVNFLADQHHPKAEFMKGMWLEFGKFGYRIDRKESWAAYRRAAEKGYARAEYRIGMLYENTNESAKAVKHYQKGASMGDSASNYRLGMMALLGQHGMPQDPQRGIDLILKAAETADENAPQGSYVYGMLLARELDRVSVPEQLLPYDLNEAKMFIEKAAYLGFAKAQLKMAQAYELCQLGCEFEPALSLQYNALAARPGEAEADMAISKWFLCGYEGIFEKNEELAFTYAKRAAQTKLPTAEFAMGYFYEIGMYVPVDLRESESWYAKAAEHGNKDALGRIDSLKKNKALKKEDHEQIAISRIKSQYGSQRGSRPERFKQKTAPMPSMAEDSRVDMPDHRGSYSAASGQLRPQSNGPLPARPKSAAPYPDDDMPLPGQPPYANQSLRPHSQAEPSADRPSSAFGIRPLSHVATETQYDHRGSLAPGPLRPSTSMGSMPVPTGGSNAADRGRVASTGWEPQVPAKYHEPSPNRPPTLPQVDAGRPLGFDLGPSRLQKPLPPNANKPYPQAPQLNQPYPPTPQSSQAPYSQGYGASQRPGPQEYNQLIPRRDPSANQLTRPERGSSMTPVGVQTGTHAGTPVMNQAPGRYESMHGQVQNASRASNRPTTAISSQSAESRHSSVTPSTASSGPAAPPKKTGPATFEEMGIPAGKNESDCVSSLRSTNKFQHADFYPDRYVIVLSSKMKLGQFNDSCNSEWEHWSEHCRR
jgi:TPR repeat protein